MKAASPRAALLASAAAALAALATSLACAASDPAELEPIRKDKLSIARALAQPINHCVRQNDTTHPLFRGCIDWHSSVHGTWALALYARATGDQAIKAQLTSLLSAEKIEAERKYLADRPGFEMPYGRAWFLRLVIDFTELAGDTRLVAMGDEVAESLVAYYRRVKPDPYAHSYDNPSWALINLLQYGQYRTKAALVAFVGETVRSDFVAVRAPCTARHEANGFMAVCVNWAWLVAAVLPREQALEWLRRFMPDPASIKPIARPVSSHHNGLNFSRAWGLWHLYALTGDPAWARLYAAHFLAAYRQPATWSGDYHAVAHWVAQFGMHALRPLLIEPRTR